MQLVTALASVLVLVSFVLATPAAAQSTCKLAEGRALLEVGNYDGAITSFSCVIAADPTNAEAYLGRAQAHLLSGAWFDANSDFTSSQNYWQDDEAWSVAVSSQADTWINAHPDDPAGYILRAYHKWYTNQDADALSDYLHIERIDPDNVFALTFAGSSAIFISSGNSGTNFARALELAPDNPNVLTLIGMSYMFIGRSDLALPYLEQAPDFAPAVYYHGRVNVDLQKYASAARDFQHALDLGLGDGYRVMALVYLGKAYLSMGETAEASAAFDEADTVYPNSTDTAQQIAFAYESVDDASATANWFNEFILRAGKQTIDGDPISVGVPVNVRIQPGTVLRFPVALAAGDTLIFTATATAANLTGDPIDPLMVVLAPDGTPLRGNDDVIANRDGNSRINGFAVPANGTYTIELTSTFYGVPGEVAVSVTAS